MSAILYLIYLHVLFFNKNIILKNDHKPKIKDMFLSKLCLKKLFKHENLRSHVFLPLIKADDLKFTEDLKFLHNF